MRGGGPRMEAAFHNRDATIDLQPASGRGALVLRAFRVPMLLPCATFEPAAAAARI